MLNNRLNGVIAIVLLAVIHQVYALDAVGLENRVQETLYGLRSSYYQAIELQVPVDSVITQFEQFGATHADYRTVADAYIGSLTAYKGRLATWPRQKLKFANEGLEQLDNALAAGRDDMEIIFIHATTCYHLPFFFGRRDDARRGFLEIAERLPKEAGLVDDSLLVNIAEFLHETELMTDEELDALLKRAKENRELEVGQE